MITMLYAALCAMILMKLSFNVIRQRRLKKVSHGDGGDQDLQIAIGAHSNAAQYIPIALLLLIGLEINGADKWLIHLLGIVLIVGRVLHARGMIDKMDWRVKGMQLTISMILIAAVLNILMLPYSQIF